MIENSEKNELLIFQKGFNYSQDGPGNRLVYHLQGCNLNCAWCANPEGIPLKSTMMVIGKLKDNYCPFGAIKNGKLERKVCLNCRFRECVTKYRNKGIKLSSQKVKIEDIVSEAVSCKPMFFERGGVTFTGGEPTMQFSALYKTICLLKNNDISVAIETNGTNPLLPKLFGLVDILMLDCKQVDATLHKKHTGFSNNVILKNIRLAAEGGYNPQIRIPFIHNVNDRQEDILEFLHFFKSIKGEFTVEILPYHEYGKEKWKQCGMNYTVSDGKVLLSTVKEFEKLLIQNKVNVIHT